MRRRHRSTRARTKRARQAGSRALALGATIAAAQGADAAIFNVTNLDDAGAGSLRQAVLDANAAAGADTITFQSGLTGTITLTTGQIQITDSVDVQGPGAANLAVSGSDASRVFYIYNPAELAPGQVTISGLTITNGYRYLVGDIAGSSGGAIASVGESLTLDNVVVSNSESGGDGGGIWFIGTASPSPSDTTAVDANLTVQSSTITGNVADVNGQGRHGGGLSVGRYAPTYDYVSLVDAVITDSVFTANRSLETGGGIAAPSHGSLEIEVADTTISGNESRHGGGILVDRSVLLAQRITVSGNTASEFGGGVSVGNACGIVIESSTVANNNAGDQAGGILVGGSTGPTPPCFRIRHTTISGNTAGSLGGGMFVNYANAGLEHSIVANNVGAAEPDVRTSCCSYYESDLFVSYSLIETPGTANIIDNGGNIFSQDPQLGPLQDNGGPTETLKPAFTSPVIDAGDPAFAPPPTSDQRGLPRIAGGRIDIGSVELQPSTVQFELAAEAFDENAGTVTISVTRSGSDGAASVQVSLGGSTATGGGTDFTFAGATLSWDDNDAAPKTFDIAIDDDSLFEGNETIVLQLSAPTGATVGTPSTETVTILDNDVAVADLSIAKSASAGPYVVGDTITFTITVSNAGPQAAANVVVTDTLPTQTSLVSATPSQGSCSGTTTIICNLGSLDAGNDATITLTVNLTAAGDVTNTANVASDTAEVDAANNSSGATITIAAAVAIPALSSTVQIMLAALIGAVALGLIRRG